MLMFYNRKKDGTDVLYNALFDKKGVPLFKVHISDGSSRVPKTNPKNVSLFSSKFSVVLDDLSKFHSIYSVPHFEKSSNMEFLGGNGEKNHVQFEFKPPILHGASKTRISGTRTRPITSVHT